MIGRLFASAIPVGLAILGVLIANLPVSVLGGHISAPLLGLMPVYFWGLVRPDLMPPIWAFLIGVLEDIFSGGPPGIWGLAFVVSFALIDRQRDTLAGLSGLGAILGFAAAAGLACAAAFAVVAVIYWPVPPWAPVLGEWGMSVVFYPLAVIVMGSVHRRLVGAQRSDF